MPVLSEKAMRIKPSATLSIDAKTKKMKAEGFDVVSFGVGEPDFQTPDNVKNAAILAIQNGFTKYTPASGTDDLRQAIAEKLLKDNHLTYESSQIVVSNGAKHSLTNIFTATLNPGDEVILPVPFWLSYAEMINLAGGTVVPVQTTKETGFKINYESLKKAFTNKTKALVLNSPNNPTGMVYTKEELTEIARFACEHDIFVISDEIYEKLIYDNKTHVSIASLGDDIYNRTIVVNGLSKSYSMTGWRIGYTASNKELAKVMGNIQSHQTSNPNSIAQKASAAAIMENQKSVCDMKTEFEKRRNFIFERISGIPKIHAIKADGAFYAFVDISELCGISIKGKQMNNAADVAMAILEGSNVAVVPCGDFGADKFIRLAFAISMEEIEKGVSRIEGFIKKYYS